MAVHLAEGFVFRDRQKAEAAFSTITSGLVATFQIPQVSEILQFMGRGQAHLTNFLKSYRVVCAINDVSVTPLFMYVMLTPRAC